jgi:hypothetical protein
VVKIKQEGAIIDMFIKKFKRKCDVRGCKNTMNVYLLSKRREFGNTVAVCRDCLEKALAQTDSYIEVAKVKREPQQLFPHPELNVTLSSVAEVEPEPVEVIEEAPTEDNDDIVTEDTVAEEPIVAEPKVVTPPKTNTSNKKKSNKKK